MSQKLESPSLDVLISESAIQQRVRELGRQVSADYHNRELHLVGVLTGAFLFMADLSRALEISPVVHFIQASSYGDSTSSSGNVHLSHALKLAGKHVLVVEDILDTGLTLAKILQDFRSYNPASLEICTLLNKNRSRTVSIMPKYNGFMIEDEFVVGYGLDLAGRYRTLPHIAVIQP
ncbi:MAG: hypoxanthine phosphoribosyltransferase [SAR324 cluster bacterium]|nr:hypoxanthine phosphoribosyltransferase [SAR324 cluster bacterium]